MRGFRVLYSLIEINKQRLQLTQSHTCPERRYADGRPLGRTAVLFRHEYNAAPCASWLRFQEQLQCEVTVRLNKHHRERRVNQWKDGKAQVAHHRDCFGRIEVEQNRNEHEDERYEYAYDWGRRLKKDA